MGTGLEHEELRQISVLRLKALHHLHDVEVSFEVFSGVLRFVKVRLLLVLMQLLEMTSLGLCRTVDPINDLCGMRSAGRNSDTPFEAY